MKSDFLPGELTPAEKAAIANAVEARIDSYVEAARRRDLNWFLDFWADVDDFVLAGDGNLVGRDAWVDQLRKAVADIREFIDFEFFNRHTYVLARDAAVHTTQYRWAIVKTSGETLRMHGSWSYVFKNFDGVWKVVHSAGTHLPD
jgi:ketosteroid isomerase-like protein